MSDQCPIHFYGIDHVALKVTAIERSLHFYTQVLGLNLERIIEDVGIYQLRCGRNLIDQQVLSANKHRAERRAPWYRPQVFRL